MKDKAAYPASPVETRKDTQNEGHGELTDETLENVSGGIAFLSPSSSRPSKAYISTDE